MNNLCFNRFTLRTDDAKTRRKILRWLALNYRLYEYIPSDAEVRGRFISCKPFPADFHSCEVMGGRGSDFQWLVPLALANFTGTFVSRQPLLREGQAYAEIRRYGIYDATTVDEWSENNNDNS